METHNLRHKHVKRGGHKVTRKFLGAAALAALLAARVTLLKAQAPEPPAPPTAAPAPVPAVPRTFVFGDAASHLGVELDDVTAEQANELKLPFVGGAMVKSVEEHSPAEKAGLQAGDVIIEFDGVRVRGASELRRLIRETPSGRSVAIKIVRDGKARTLNAQVEAAGNPFNFNIPEIRVPRMEEIPPSFGPRHVTLGISGDDLTPQLAEYFGVKQGKGVLITSVTKGGPADKAGLKAGDVIVQLDGKTVGSIDELRFRLNHFLDDTRNVSIAIVRDRRQQTVHVDLNHFHVWEQQTSSILTPRDTLQLMQLWAATPPEANAANVLPAPAERARVQAEVSKQQQYLEREWQRQLQEQVQILRQQLQRMQTVPVVVHPNDEI